SGPARWSSWTWMVPNRWSVLARRIARRGDTGRLENPAVQLEETRGVFAVLRDVEDGFWHEPRGLEPAAWVLGVAGPPHRLARPPSAGDALGRVLHAPAIHLRLTDVTGGPVGVDELVHVRAMLPVRLSVR